jgi:hypothetical protein
MGNCLKGSSNDDVSLLRENEGQPENMNEPLHSLQYRVSNFFFSQAYFNGKS